MKVLEYTNIKDNFDERIINFSLTFEDFLATSDIKVM